MELVNTKEIDFNEENFIKYDDILIVFNSLIKCIIEYPINKESKKKLMEFENYDEEDEEFCLQNYFIVQLIKTFTDNSNQKKKEINNKIFFILNTFTLLDILRVKTLNNEKINSLSYNNKINDSYLYFLWSKIFVLIFYYMFLYLDAKKVLKSRIDKIIEDKETLLNIYIENKIKNTQIFNSIILNYQLAFHAPDTDKFIDIKSLFYINNKRINLENTIKNIEKNLYLLGNGNILLVIFSFLQDIHDIIEVRLTKDTNIEFLNTLIPENFNLKKYSFLYFEKHIDYIDRETKLLSIYNYIECLINDMKKKKNELDYSINFSYGENFNYFCILLENIFMIINYSKSIEESIENYNKIDNRQKFSKYILCIICIGSIHILMLIITIFTWFICRFSIENFYAIKKYKIENSIKCPIFKNEEIKSLDIDIDEKSKLKKDIYKYYRLQDYDLEKYYGFFLNIIKKIEEKFVICFYTLRTIYPFFITLICLILYFIGWQIALVIPIFLLFNLSETLLAIIKVLFNEIITLFLLLLFMIIILYFFSWIGFFYIPKMFKYDSVDNNNELIGYEENICSSAISCILYFWNFGLTSEGVIDMNLISYKNNYTYYLGQFFFNIILYGMIHMIFFNVFLATITDSFGEMKNKIRKKDEDIKKTCFICQMTENDCVNEFKDFDEHCQKHDKWKYIMFICNILQKEEKELNKEEYIIYKKIKDKNIDWFPKYKKPNEIKKIKKSLDEFKIKFAQIEQKIDNNNEIIKKYLNDKIII